MLDAEKIKRVGGTALRLARITSKEDLILCEEVHFTRGAPAVAMVLRRAAISGRVEWNGKIKNHFADVLDGNGDLVATVALDNKSYGALKNKWMRCRTQPHAEPKARTKQAKLTENE